MLIPSSRVALDEGLLLGTNRPIHLSHGLCSRMLVIKSRLSSDGRLTKSLSDNSLVIRDESAYPKFSFSFFCNPELE